MKPRFKHLFPALAAFTLSATPAIASDDFAPGDLAIAFYSFTDPTGPIAPDTYVVNLGPASLYRENTQNNVAVSAINTALASSNIGADLVEKFGENWANDGLLRWMVVGGVGQLGPVTAGDPARTTYISRARASFATGALGPGSTIASISSNPRGTLSNNVANFLIKGTNDGIHMIGQNTSTSGVNVAGAFLPTSNVLSVEKYLPPVTNGLYFGVGVDPRQKFSPDALPGGAAIEGALDIYRVLHTATDADLTAGASSGNAEAGTGQFIGTLTLDASGNLKIVGVGAAVNPDTDNDGLPDAWEDTNFGNRDQTAEGDFDNDGTNNLTEFRLGLNPKSGDSRFAVTRGNDGALVWPSAVGATFIVQRSTTLLPGSWGNDVTVSGTAGTATYTDPAPPAGRAFYRVLLQP